MVAHRCALIMLTLTGYVHEWVDGYWFMYPPPPPPYIVVIYCLDCDESQVYGKYIHGCHVMLNIWIAGQSISAILKL